MTRDVWYVWVFFSRSSPRELRLTSVVPRTVGSAPAPGSTSTGVGDSAPGVLGGAPPPAVVYAAVEGLVRLRRVYPGKQARVIAGVTP